MTVTTPHEALVYIMVTLSAADTSMTDAELSQIGHIIRKLPVFDGFDEDRLVDIARNCQQLLEEDDGLEQILELAHDALPERLYDTAYALAVEVAAADLHVEQEELRFLQMLRDKLVLDKLTIAAIEKGAAARYRTIA